jgi:hypothetical protein
MGRHPNGCSFCCGSGCEACNGDYGASNSGSQSSSEGCGGEGCCDYDRPAYAPKPKSDKEELEEVLGLLYDLSQEKNKDHAKISQLLSRYKKVTGKDKPAFM